MGEDKNANDIITLFQRSKIENTFEPPKPINISKTIDLDEAQQHKIFKAIMKQFVSNKKHIEAVKKIDTGDFTKEYFEENLPHYSSKLHDVLEKCSKKKIHDDKQVLNHKEGIFVLDFS